MTAINLTEELKAEIAIIRLLTGDTGAYSPRKRTDQEIKGAE